MIKNILDETLVENEGKVTLQEELISINRALIVVPFFSALVLGVLLHFSVEDTIQQLFEQISGFIGHTVKAQAIGVISVFALFGWLIGLVLNKRFFDQAFSSLLLGISILFTTLITIVLLEVGRNAISFLEPYHVTMFVMYVIFLTTTIVTSRTYQRVFFSLKEILLLPIPFAIFIGTLEKILWPANEEIWIFGAATGFSIAAVILGNLRIAVKRMVRNKTDLKYNSTHE